jgi:hypothetical protein
MNYSDTIEMIDFLNDRMHRLKPWYTWGVEITWEKLERWARRLGWEPLSESGEETKEEKVQ